MLTYNEKLLLCGLAIMIFIYFKYWFIGKN